MLYSLSVRVLLLFVMRILSCLIIAAVSTICFIASQMLQWTFGELMTESCFPGRISKVYYVVNRLFTTVAVVVCAMRPLLMVF